MSLIVKQNRNEKCNQFINRAIDSAIAFLESLRPADEEFEAQCGCTSQAEHEAVCYTKN